MAGPTKRKGKAPEEEEEPDGATKWKELQKSKRGGIMAMAKKMNNVNIFIALALVGFVFAVYFLWTGGPRRPRGLPPPPAFTESLSFQIKIAVPMAKAFKYLSTPETWPHWRPSTLRVDGAIDDTAKPGMLFTERSMFEGTERDITWTTTFAGVDTQSGTRGSQMRVAFTGSFRDIQRKVFSTYTVSMGKNATMCDVAHALSFGYKGLTSQQKDVVKGLYRDQLRLALKQLRQRLQT